MADSTTGLHVKSLATESVRAKLVDTGGTNEAAISAAGRISVDGSGVTQPVSGTVAVSSITTNVVPGTGATHLGKAQGAVYGAGDTGVMSLAVRNDAGTVLTGSADQDYIPLTTDSSGALRVTGGSGGTQYTEDTVAAGAEALTMAGTVRQDTPASSNADGDYANLKTDSVGRLWVNGSGVTQPVSDAGGSLTVDNGGTFAVQVSSIAAGTNNIGDVDVLTVPAPLSTSGNGSAATALRVTLANDSTGIVTLTGSLPVGTNNIGDVDVLTLPNVTLAAGTNTNEVVGDVAHDAVAAGNPVLVGMYASAAAPSDVSADGDVARPWVLRNGSQVTNLASGGTLVTLGSKVSASSLPVVIASDQGAVASNITQVGGATQSATNPLFTRLTNGTAALANLGETAATGNFVRITDATNTAAVIATINSLKTDLSSVAGAVPSATNPVPVRLTDGSAFYASASGAPTTPTFSTVTSSALGAGSAVDLDHTAITGGTTGYLMGADVSSAVPLKVEIKTVNAGTPTTRIVMFTQNGDNLQWRAPFKSFITQSGGATSRFRVTVTNRDNSQASDVYSTAFWDQF